MGGGDKAPVLVSKGKGNIIWNSLGDECNKHWKINMVVSSPALSSPFPTLTFAECTFLVGGSHKAQKIISLLKTVNGNVLAHFLT